MTSVTPPRRRRRGRSALVSAAVVLLLGAAAGCDSGDDISGGGEDADPSTSDHAEEAPEVSTVMSIEHGEGIDPAHQEKLVEGITGVVDPWFEGAFLGDFPRDDFSAAFAGFSPGAAEDAQRDIDILSNAGLSAQIDSATATNRRVRLDVFAPKGHPRGVTANFVLDFTTTGEVERQLRVHGALYLAKDKGVWKVFGYDVDQAVEL